MLGYKSQLATLPACRLPGNGTPMLASNRPASFQQVEPSYADLRRYIWIFFILEWLLHNLNLIMYWSNLEKWKNIELSFKNYSLELHKALFGICFKYLFTMFVSDFWFKLKKTFGLMCWTKNSTQSWQTLTPRTSQTEPHSKANFSRKCHFPDSAAKSFIRLKNQSWP